jgi:hypothetical protein
MFQRGTSRWSRDIADSRRAVSLGIVMALVVTAGCSGSGDPTAPGSGDSSDGPTSPDAESAVLRDGTHVTSLLIGEPRLGKWIVAGQFSYNHVFVMPGEPLHFFWHGVDVQTPGTWLGSRYGWDLSDPDDPDDPGWAVQLGGAAENFETGEVTFWHGLHELTVELWDADRQRLVRTIFAVSAEPVLVEPPPRGGGDAGS